MAELLGGIAIRHALSAHDPSQPISAFELLTLASEMETVLVEGEHQFSHPDWKAVDGLRVLACSLPELYADAIRYRFLRDNPLQLRAIDGNASERVAATVLDARVDDTRLAALSGPRD